MISISDICDGRRDESAGFCKEISYQSRENDAVNCTKTHPQLVISLVCHGGCLKSRKDRKVWQCFVLLTGRSVELQPVHLRTEAYLLSFPRLFTRFLGLLFA
jgi:hypothetical protein